MIRSRPSSEPRPAPPFESRRQANRPILRGIARLSTVRDLNVGIEPVIVGKWARLMCRATAPGRGAPLSVDELHQSLIWLDPARDTRLLWTIATELLARSERVYCAWSGKRLDERSLDIDHCFPG
jgi:hypothetical protein